MTYSVLILAGNRGPACSIAALDGVSHKALLSINGVTMIERVISALREVTIIEKVTIAIETPEVLKSIPNLKPLFTNGYLETIIAMPTPAQSVLNGFEALSASQNGPILMTTADNCLLTSEIVQHFINSLNQDTDVTAAVAKTDWVLEAYPQARRTRMSFSDGSQGGCNLFAFQTGNARNIINFWRLIEQNRKSPLTMLRQLGFWVVLRYLSNSLSIEQALNKLGQRTGTKLAITQMPFPEAAIDVDTIDDYKLVESILSKRENK